MKIEGLMERQVHPDRGERFIVQEGNLRHEYYGRERFARWFEHQHGPGKVAHVVSVTTMGSDCDEYLLVKVTADEEPDGGGASDAYFEHVNKRLDQVVAGLAAISEALEELLRRTPKG